MASRTPLLWKLVIRTANNPERLGSSGKFVGNSTKLTCLEITDYRIKCNTALRLLELQIRRGRKVQTHVHTVNSNSRTSDYQCFLFSKRNPIIRMFRLSGRLSIPINPGRVLRYVQSSFFPLYKRPSFTPVRYLT